MNEPWRTYSEEALDRSGREVLQRAAEVVRDRGLTKGKGIDDVTGEVCATAAINIAAEQLDAPVGRAYSMMLNHIEPYTSVSRWNDKWWRTRGQVVRALRAAAKFASYEDDAL